MAHPTVQATAEGEATCEAAAAEQLEYAERVQQGCGSIKNSSKAYYAARQGHGGYAVMSSLKCPCNGLAVTRCTVKKIIAALDAYPDLSG